MITPALIANKQFRNANLGMLFFGAGAIGTPAAALARVHQPVGLLADRGRRSRSLPVPLCGLLVWPFVGRAARTPRAPGEIAKPALIVMARRDAVGLVPALHGGRRLDLHPILPGLMLFGVGHGHRLPGAERGRDGRGGRPGGRPRLGRPQHLPAARRGVRRSRSSWPPSAARCTRICRGSPTTRSRTSWTTGRSRRRWRAQVIQSTLHDYTGGDRRPLRAQAGLRRGDHPRDRGLRARGLRLGVPAGGAPDPHGAAAPGRPEAHARPGAGGVHGADAGTSRRRRSPARARWSEAGRRRSTRRRPPSASGAPGDLEPGWDAVCLGSDAGGRSRQGQRRHCERTLPGVGRLSARADRFAGQPLLDERHQPRRRVLGALLLRVEPELGRARLLVGVGDSR